MFSIIVRQLAHSGIRMIILMSLLIFFSHRSSILQICTDFCLEIQDLRKSIFDGTKVISEIRLEL